MAPADLDMLLDLAAAAGAERGWLDRMARELLERDLELAELRRHLDRRALAAIETGRRVRALHARGLRPAAIVKRTGIPKTSVYRYLRESPTA